LSSIPDNSLILAPILITLLTLRYYNERLYREYKHNPILLEQVISFIFRELEKSRNKYIGFSVFILIDIISYLIIFADDAEKEPKLITQYESSITSHRKNNSSYPNYQQTADTQELSNRINEIREGLRWRHSSSRNFRKIVFEQIELLHQFNIN
jgi:cell division protein FtsL